MGMMVAPTPLPSPDVTPRIAPRVLSNQPDTTRVYIMLLGSEPTAPIRANRP